MHDTKLPVGKSVKQRKQQITVGLPRPLLAELDHQVRQQDRSRAEILIEAFTLYMRLKDRVAITIKEETGDVQQDRPSTGR
ncbi:MAG: ribbon-helix-helix protein, CopG family [Candidatus Thiodiazotropha taylori]|nr:ribbon-helix-helix protein, CopG family [Candidatus Thiodiazotropha taylori]MCG8095364.1 ribbon-helix-helix protein, CopG family [Candidatus Thiodiazotropha endolucinida]MCG7882918.1 ribbon-helix-helix protein, CopG family [Candidatus Thiodiazotropha taylori]MCG7888538.1 ribbon-helix-helix protein, CopG family [Candidatus Thiodiazotropha taylori]MCG7892268.1 ribbon-helix-helix protein, CopG family [Candidatus Thiodiazotropha taylori]